MPLIVGLGNPGKEYDGTPHNVGFDVLGRVVRRNGLTFRRSRSGKAEEAILPGSPKTILLRPLSFMNLSGIPVVAALKWNDFKPTDLLVICDDVNIPPGTLRMRLQGGAGGQKGLKSIIDQLGTDEFPRLRIGIGGGYPGSDVASYVLGRFPSALHDVMEKALEDAANAIESFLRDGIEVAMNRYNTPRSLKDNSNPSDDIRSSDKSSPKGES